MGCAGELTPSAPNFQSIIGVCAMSKASRLAVLDRYISEAEERITLLRADFDECGLIAMARDQALERLAKLRTEQTERRALRAKIGNEPD